MRSTSFGKFDGWWRENHAAAVLVAVLEHCPEFADGLYSYFVGGIRTLSCVAVSREVTASRAEEDEDSEAETDSRRRIDVLISAVSGNVGIALGIEVKIHAPFRPGQLPAYHGWLSRYGSDDAILGVLVPEYRVPDAERELRYCGEGCQTKVLTWRQVIRIARDLPQGALGRDWSEELVRYLEEDLMLGSFPGVSVDIVTVLQTGSAMSAYLGLLLAIAARLDAVPTKRTLIPNTGSWKTYDYICLFIRCKREGKRGWIGLTTYKDRRGATPDVLQIEVQFDKSDTVSVPFPLAQVTWGAEDPENSLVETCRALKEGIDRKKNA